MCKPWKHKFVEQQRETLKIIKHNILNNVEYNIGELTRITYQCSVCQKFKQIELKGNVLTDYGGKLCE
jgi:hypothetical protein